MSFIQIKPDPILDGLYREISIWKQAHDKIEKDLNDRLATFQKGVCQPVSLEMVDHLRSMRKLPVFGNADD